VIHMAARGGTTAARFHRGAQAPGLQARRHLLWTINLGLNIREGRITRSSWFMISTATAGPRSPAKPPTARWTAGAWRSATPTPTGVIQRPRHVRSGISHDFRRAHRCGAGDDQLRSAAASTKINPTSEEMRELWGDGNGNRSERYLACIAYLDGERPAWSCAAAIMPAARSPPGTGVTGNSHRSGRSTATPARLRTGPTAARATQPERRRRGP